MVFKIEIKPMAKTDYKTIDQYHAAFAGAGEIVERMQQIRDIVHELAPAVEETITYSGHH